MWAKLICESPMNYEEIANQVWASKNPRNFRLIKQLAPIFTGDRKFTMPWNLSLVTISSKNVCLGFYTFEAGNNISSFKVVLKYGVLVLCPEIIDSGALTRDLRMLRYGEFTKRTNSTIFQTILCCTLALRSSWLYTRRVSV